MCFNNKVCIALLITLVYGCSSDSKRDDDKVNIIQTIEKFEGTPFTAELSATVSVKNNQNQNIYFTLNNSVIEGVTPNVEQDKSFFIELSENQAIEVKVKNKNEISITSETRIYAFANGNIAKYNQYLSDGTNIPLVTIGEQKVHYPVTVSKYAHDLYANYKSTRDVDVLDKFYINAIWLRDNCIYTSYGFCSWRTEPAYTPFETGDNWSSAMAQGQAISVMISAYSLTQDPQYLKIAQDAISAFFYPTTIKGVMSTWEGGVWYEEYGSNNPAHVLNGFLFSMAGLYDAIELLNDGSAKIAFDLGIHNLKDKLNRYDVDFTSLYDQNDQQLRFANAKTKSLDGYHELHVLQLAWVYQVTQEPEFLSTFKTFLADDISSFNARYIKSGLSNRIENIETSYSVRLGTNGPAFLNDRNWTYGNYWSTNKNGTQIVFNLNQVNDSPGIKCLMMSSIDKKYFPKYFDVFSFVNGQWQLEIQREDVEKIQYSDHTWAYQGKESTARTFCFDHLLKTTDKFKIEVYLGDSNLIALKEMDVHFERPAIEQELLSIYDGWKPNL